MIFSIISQLSTIAKAEAIAIPIIFSIYTVYLQKTRYLQVYILTVHEVLKKSKQKSRKVK